MASPSILVFCCTNSRLLQQLDFHKTFYNSVCLLTSAVGLGGAVYQFFAHSPLPASGIRRNEKRQSYIIRWLALADAMACIGILIRSLTWIGSEEIYHMMNEFLRTWFCALISAWTEYFYCVTYVWTLLYAVDVHRLLNNQDFTTCRYHCIAWLVPLALSVCGLGITYSNGFMCNDDTRSYLYLLPNYLVAYLPMVFIIVANPVIYYSCCKKMREQLCIWQPFRSGHTEAQLAALKEKFLWMTAVFVSIWLPNLVHGIVIWSMWHNLPKGLILCIWYMMAVLNPLQALLNVFVYRSWRRHVSCSDSSCCCCWWCCFNRRRESRVTFVDVNSSEDLAGDMDQDNVHTPLLDSINGHNHSL